MDYLNTYKYFSEKYYNYSKIILIKQFKKANKKNRPFLTIANKLLCDFKKYRTENYESVLTEKGSVAYLEFQNRYKYYRGDEYEIIGWVLNDEVLKAFTADDTYSYKSFIRDLAIHESLNECFNHFYNYYGYYELIYDTDKYEYFYLKDFQGISFENSSEYQEMLDLKYPERIKERQESELAEKAKRKGGKPALSIKNKDEISKEEIDSIEIINSFLDSERAILFSIFNDEMKKNNLSEIPVTELIRFTKIIGSYEDLSIFNKNVKDSTFYSMTNKGIHYYTSKDGQKKLIEDIIAKLKKLKVSFMLRLLKKLLLELR